MAVEYVRKDDKNFAKADGTLFPIVTKDGNEYVRVQGRLILIDILKGMEFLWPHIKKRYEKSKQERREAGLIKPGPRRLRVKHDNKGCRIIKNSWTYYTISPHWLEHNSHVEVDGERKSCECKFRKKTHNLATCSCDTKTADSKLSCDCATSKYGKLPCWHTRAIGFSLKMRDKVRADMGSFERPPCKFCGSSDVISKGIISYEKVHFWDEKRNTFKDSFFRRRVFKCKQCSRKFRVKMIHMWNVLAVCINGHYLGLSTRRIADDMNIVNHPVSKDTITKWIKKYEELMHQYRDKAEHPGIKGDPFGDIRGKELYWMLDRDTQTWLSSMVQSHFGKKLCF